MTRRVVGSLGLALLLSGGIGCGGDAEKGDRADEASATTEGTAAVDLSDGKIQVSDGKGGTYDLDAGESAGLPEGFPAELEVPATTEILVASTTSTDGRALQQVTVQFDGPVAAAYEAYKQQMTDAGYRIESDNIGDTEGRTFGSATASDGDSSVSATFSEGPGGQGTASITVAAR